MKKRILSLLLVLAFLLGLLPTMALAGESITATVQAAPSTVTVQFFTDEACETPVDAEAVTLNGVEGKYNTYTLALPSGTYYYRGMDGSVDLGGGTLVLTEAENQSVSLIRHNFYVNNTAFNMIGDYSLTGLKDLSGAEVVLGAPYVESGKVYTPALLIGGMKYDGGTISIADSKLDGYYPGTLSAFTPSATATAVQSKTLTVTAYKTFSLTAPSDAEVEFYNQTKNFVVSLMDRSEMTGTDNGDGTTTTYAFKSKSTNYSGQYSFRVSKIGEATQAGFFQNGEAVTVTFPKHSATEAASSEGLLGSDDRSVLLNVGSTGELHLTAGESFRLRAFRAPWEIVDSTTGNHMIEPDFHVSVLSGEDVVRITPVTDTVTGNASGNWMTVEALKDGTAVVAVWYDAIDVYTFNSTTKAFTPLTYGAADPARYGVFVVTVGEDNTVTWNPVSADGDWDSEFDTVHYTGEGGTFTFKPTETLTDVTVTNVYGAQMGKAQTVSASEDGSYAVPVTEGANIIAASTAAGTDYFVVRAKKINVTVTNNTTGKTDADEDFTVTVGDSVTVSFDQIAMPVPKMSGIYNPGYLGTMKTVYTLNDTYTLSSKGAQYTYPDDSAITFTAYLPGENVLTGGVTNMTSMGDPFGNHRNLTDEGRAANLNAQEVPGIFGTLPDVSFTVLENPEAQIDAESLTKLKSVSIYNGPSTYQCGVNINAVSASKDYSWTATNAAQMANWDFHFLVTAESYYNTIEARYWYEGESVHTLKLTSGIAATVPASEFPGDASKMLNVEIVVTPADPSLGDAKVYSYVVMGGTASLKYVHPALRSLTVTDAESNPLTLVPALRYSNTEYTLDVGAAQVLNLSAQQLQKYTNATNNTQDKSDTVTVTLLKGGAPLDGGIIVLPETEDRYPVGKWTLNDIGITEADAIQIAVKSYVNDLTRTYVIKLVKDVPAPVEPAEDAEILVTVSSKGVLAADKDGKVMVNRPVTVKDLNSDGVLTVEEALIAAHAAYLSDSGYASSATEYGISVTKLWNVDTYNTLFFVNGTALASGVGVDTVSAGDRLLASVNADDLYYSDWYTAFDAAEQRVKTLVPFTLKLTGCQGMAYPFDPTASVAGVQLGIWENGAFNAIEGAVTDETGSATLSFEKPGTYYVTAKGTVSDDVITDWVNYTTEKKDCPVIAPVCVVTVEEATAPYFSTIRVYESEADYKRGAAPYQMTPVYSPDTDSQLDYKIAIPDYISKAFVFAQTEGMEGYLGDTDHRSIEFNGTTYTMMVSNNWSGWSSGTTSLLNAYFISHASFTNAGYNGKYIDFYLREPAPSYATAVQVRIEGIKTASLKGIDMDGVWETAFAPESLTSAIYVDGDSGGIDVTATGYKNNYTITIGGQSETSGTAIHVAYNWDADGEMELPITVTPGADIDGFRGAAATYIVTLKKMPKDEVPGILTQPADAEYTLCETDPAPVAMRIAASANGDMTYQWYKSANANGIGAVAIEGATEASYTPVLTEPETVYYFCRVTNTAAAKSADSNAAKVVVYADPTPVLSFRNEIPDLTVKEHNGFEFPVIKGYFFNVDDEGAELEIVAETSVPDAEITYLWSRGRSTYMADNKAKLTVGTDITYANNEGTEYTCDVTVIFNGRKYTAKSAPVFVYVAADHAITPVIEDALKDAEYELNAAGKTLYVQTAFNKTLMNAKFQWYVNTERSTEGATPVEGATLNQLKIPTDVAGTFYYFLRVTNHQQGYTATGDSVIAKITIIDPDAVEVILTGDGTEESPYLIRTVDDLLALKKHVNEDGFDFKDRYVRLENDLTVTNETWTESIGITKDGTTQLQNGDNLRVFSGVFNGNGHTLTFGGAGTIKPLFGYVRGTTVKNLNIQGGENVVFENYGLINHIEGVGINTTAATIDNVTLKSGTKTMMSGFAGGKITVNGYAAASAGFVTYIRNCTVEKGCVIGVNGDQSMIGSFAGRLICEIENCVSYATVKGKSYVGGIIGTMDNAMGVCAVKNSEFHGEVIATGKNVGGIVGGGYENSTAPNGGRVNLLNNKVDGKISGAQNVGGILGGDEYVAQSWGSTRVSDNEFTGTVSGSENVGAIIGFYDSLNKFNEVKDNLYTKDCGAEKGIAAVKYVDTNCAKPTLVSGTTYLNTENSVEDCPAVDGCGWKVAHNRTDDPLGADAEKLCRVFGSAPIDEPIDEPGDEPGTDVGGDITVYFTLLGDTLHGGNVKHTYAAGNLVTWMARAPYTIEANTTVGAFLKWLDDGEDLLRINNPGGNYIESITYGSVTLGEFDNTNISGWMYLLNGTHPDKGVGEQYLSDGDEIIFHFTDDYTKEQGGEEWNDPGTGDTPVSPSEPITEPTEQPSGEVKKREYSAESGKVPAIVNADGTKTIVKKSYADGKTAYALVPDGAKILFVDNRKSFADVKNGDWYADAIDFVTAHELFNGLGKDIFAPDMPMSRAMLVTVLYRLEDTPDYNVEAAFRDVHSGDWYADAVLWALENHITEGMGSGAFGADMDVTREQIATFLYRYAKYIGLDVSASGSLEAFPDGGKVSGWAQDAMKWAAGAGLFRGDNHGMLNPGKSATRAEVATLLMRLVERIVK